MKTKNLIDAKWSTTTKTPDFTATKTKLFGSQPAAYKALRDARHVILNAPTGWGKSVVIAMLILYKLIRDPKLRCIITVPQTVIANGFLRNWILRVSGNTIDWAVAHNLCDGSETHKARGLCRFLRGPNRGLPQRILICTHATLAKAFKKRRNLFTNVLVWIDEAHHVMNAQVRDRKTTVSNMIGKLVKHCLKGTNTHVGLATATFMRGDMRHIVPDALESCFTRHDVPYDVYFETMRPVEHFTFDVICGHHLDAIARIFKKHAPTIIYLAKRNSRYATGCKYKEVDQIIKQLAKGGKVKREGTLILAGGLKILDLVTEAGRGKRKAHLDEIKAREDLDVILALDMCKEGFDWVWAERSIIVGERHSIPEMIQMIGRLFRRAKGKRTAEVYQVMPAVVEDSKKFKDQRNDILTVIFSAMLLEDVFLPVECTGTKKRGGLRLASVVPDTDAWQALCRDALVHANGKSYKQSLRFAKTLVVKHGFPETGWETIWQQVWTRLAVCSRKMKGLSVKKIAFSVLKKIDITDGLLTFCSDLCGTMTFQELRQIIGRETRTLEEWVEVAEWLARENAAGRLAV